MLSPSAQWGAMINDDTCGIFWISPSRKNLILDLYDTMPLHSDKGVHKAHMLLNIICVPLLNYLFFGWLNQLFLFKFVLDLFDNPECGELLPFCLFGSGRIFIIHLEYFLTTNYCMFRLSKNVLSDLLLFLVKHRYFFFLLQLQKIKYLISPNQLKKINPLINWQLIDNCE